MPTRSQPRTQKDRFDKDLKEGFATAVSANPGLAPQDAMIRYTRDMLVNNPFNPPTEGCPINGLPNELLAYIFAVGTKMDDDDDGSDDSDEEDEYADELDLIEEWETDSDEEEEERLERRGALIDRRKSIQDEDSDDDDEDEEEEDERVLPFQVLVSHVCRHWREVAIQSPELWTTLTFSEGYPFEKSRISIERSKGLPLDIYIDCTIPEDWDPTAHVHDNDSDCEGDHDHNVPQPFVSQKHLSVVLDLVVPHVAQWRLFEVTVSLYDNMHLVLSRLAECPAAPLLEVFMLYHYEDCDEYETFALTELKTAFLPFHGIAPKLIDVALWGVHIAWDESLSFLTGLRDVEFAYHAKDVRPSYETFTKILNSSPDIRTLSLCLSGPGGNPDEDWSKDIIELPSLTDLVLCYHEPAYIGALMSILSTPNVHSLALDYDDDDYTSFAQQLTRPMPGKSKSLLVGLEHLKISGLPCNNKTIDMVLEQLTNLKSFNLNCSGESEEPFFHRLIATTSGTKVYCPNLHTMTTTGIEGSRMRAFVEARKTAGVPLKKVFMSQEDEVNEKEEKWLRDNLEALEFFEPSDTEEEMELEVDDDGVEMDVYLD